MVWTVVYGSDGCVIKPHLFALSCSVEERCAEISLLDCSAEVERIALETLGILKGERTQRFSGETGTTFVAAPRQK